MAAYDLVKIQSFSLTSASVYNIQFWLYNSDKCGVLSAIQSFAGFLVCDSFVNKMARYKIKHLDVSLISLKKMKKIIIWMNHRLFHF